MQRLPREEQLLRTKLHVRRNSHNDPYDTNKEKLPVNYVRLTSHWLAELRHADE